jgi:hypothetical protein
MAGKKKVKTNNCKEGKTCNTPKKESSKLPLDIAADIYRNCHGCKLKVKKIDILGGHCSFKGVLKIQNGKCTTRK